MLMLLWIVSLDLKKEEREKKETSGAYIGPCQRYVMEFLSEYSQRFLAGHIQKKFNLRYLTGS